MRTIACFLAVTSIAAADDIIMKTGRKIDGVVKKETETVIVLEIGGGTVTIERHLIAEIRYDAETAVRHGRDRAQAVKDSKDPLALWKAADWCETHGVSKELRPLIDRALQLDLEDNRMSPERYMLKLARQGISDKTLRAYVMLYDIETDFSTEERKRLYDAGMKLELLEWLQARQEARRPPPPAPEPLKAAPPPPPAPVAPAPPKDCGIRLPPPVLVSPQLYPTYVPNYYGPYIYYYPYLNVIPYFMTPPPQGQSR